MTGSSLSICLIVRNEAHHLPDCLESVRAVAGEIIVHDTGSSDGTAELAEAAGATVIRGHWSGDFAAARNVCLHHARGDWVLSLDADERVVASPGLLPVVLANAARPAWMVEVHNVISPEAGGDYRFRAPKLFRRPGARWSGAVHEQPLDASGTELATMAAAMPQATLRIVHLGYADSQHQQAKARRNAEIAEAELAGLVGRAHDTAELARVLLNTGRSLLGAGRRQDAFDTFDVLRRLAPGRPEWLQATDYLVLLLLGDAQAHRALPLIDGLRRAGGPAQYCDWLTAQALVALGRPEEAWALLEGITELVDTAGRHYSPGRLHELRALVAAAGDRCDSALDELLLAMLRYGRVGGHGELLRHLWVRAGRDMTELDTVVVGPHADAARRELRRHAA